MGACAIILFARKGTIAFSLLSMKPVVGLGLISYSAYLWHQPLFAFARIGSMNEPSTQFMVVLIIMSIVVAYFSWRYVEVPARVRGAYPFPTRRTVVATLGSLGSLLIAVGMVGHLTKGMPQRFTADPKVQSFLDAYDDSLPEWRYKTRHGLFAKYATNCDFYDIESFRHGVERFEPRPSIDRSCYTRNSAQPHSVFIWGDSHAQMLRYGLSNVLPDGWQILQVASSGCKPSLAPANHEYCTHSNEVAFKSIMKSKPDVVILAQRSEHNASEMDAIANKLAAIGIKKIVATGPTPQWTRELPWVVVAQLWNSNSDRSFVALKQDVFLSDMALKDYFSRANSLTYVSLVDAFCNEKGCLNYLGKNRETDLVSWDYGHLTPMASEYLAKNRLARAVEDGIANSTASSRQRLSWRAAKAF